jgi:ATP adenylyltransferase
MKKIWAPWRMDYILEKKDQGCFLCGGLSEKKDGDNLILYRGKLAFVIMNRFPYNNGHLMVVPKRHCIDLDELNGKEGQELFYLMQVSIRVLRSSLSPHGFNVGLNLGKAAGAGEEHVHFHIVPRWSGDTNYMPVLSETKVVPEHLNQTYRKLRPAFHKASLNSKVGKGGGSHKGASSDSRGPLRPGPYSHV